MLNALKVSFLFIGAIIGAGFATGREVALYFGHTSVWTVALAGILTGVFCAFFLFLGKLNGEKLHFKHLSRGINFLVILSTIITFIAMAAGAETLFYQAFGVRYIGLISGLAAAIASAFSMNAIKGVNFVLVPVLLVVTLVLFLVGRPQIYSPEHLPTIPYNAINYTAMNMMLGGFLIKQEGKKMKPKDIVLAGVVTTIFLTVMLVISYAISRTAIDAEMPLYTFSREHNLHYASAIIIFIAIFTTQLGSAKIINSSIKKIVKWDWIAVIFLSALTAFTFRYSFKDIIAKTYPIVGVIGIAFLAIAILEMIAGLIMRWKTQAKPVPPHPKPAEQERIIA